MVDRNVDSITASISSLNAVLKNKGVAILWGSLILMSVIVGFATGFLGLVIVLPVIGYATFHGAQEAILDPKTEAQKVKTLILKASEMLAFLIPIQLFIISLLQSRVAMFDF